MRGDHIDGQPPDDSRTSDMRVPLGMGAWFEEQNQGLMRNPEHVEERRHAAVSALR